MSRHCMNNVFPSLRHYVPLIPTTKWQQSYDMFQSGGVNEVVVEAPSNNKQWQQPEMQYFGYALSMNLLWCWSHWCLEEESRMRSCVLESLFVWGCFRNLRISENIRVFLEATNLKHLYFGTKWPWTLASTNSRHCTVQSLGSPRTGPRSFAVGCVCFALLKRTKPRATESTAEHMDVVFCF